MKYIITALGLLCCSAQLLAQSPMIQWQKPLGGLQIDNSYVVQRTIDGSYVIAGSSTSTAGTASQVTGNHGGIDFWILKVNDTGGIVWENSFGGSSDDVGYYLQKTHDGGFIAAGSSSSWDGDLASCLLPAYIKFWVVKLSDTGTLEWEGCYGGSNYSTAHCVQPTLDMNYVVFGESEDNDLEVTGHHGSSSFADYWLIKISATGALIWEKSLGGTLSEHGKFVSTTTDGGYICIGSSNSNDGDVTGNHLNGTLTSTDMWVVKVDSLGNIQWQKSYGGSGEEIGYTILQTYDGGYVAVGTTNSLDTGTSQVVGLHGAHDYWVVKLDDTGGITWQVCLGGSDDDLASNIQQTKDSGYVVIGTSASTDGQVTHNHGNNDMWIVKISKTGALQWEKSMGGSSVDYGCYVNPTPDSGYVTIGFTNSNDSDVSGNHGDFDYWLVKLSACRLDSAIITATGSTMHTVMPYMHYQWFFNGTLITGATNPTYTATVNGTYEVNVSDSNECVASSHAYNLTTVKANSITENGNIYTAPNPTSDLVYIIGKGYTSISVVNTVGKILKTANNVSQVSIAEYPAGLYFIKLFDENGVLVYENKIIKL
jgi:Secretion system C-terminal sorting domain